MLHVKICLRGVRNVRKINIYCGERNWKSKYPELFKNNVNSGIEKIKVDGEDEKLVVCLKNLALHIMNNPMIVRCENPEDYLEIFEEDLEVSNSRIR